MLAKALLAAEAEVAELRQERDHYRFHFDQQEQRAERAEARVKRLEEALREIAALKVAPEPAWNTVPNGEARKIARAALSEPK